MTACNYPLMGKTCWIHPALLCSEG
uniref:Uncharacterized protein n=1 Tax=Anguilla anguilla TaxID=7936 RepID=A0A0E9PBJ3_ANGAN